MSLARTSTFVGLVASGVMGVGPAAVTTTSPVDPEHTVSYTLAHGVKSRSSVPSSWIAGVISAHRVEGGTVVYWAAQPHDRSNRWHPDDATVYNGGVQEPGSVGSVAMHVKGEDKVFFPLSDGSTCLCSGGYGDSAAPDAVVVLYAVFPEVPEGVTSIEVDLSGNSTWIYDIPLTEELPEPQVDQRAVPWGEGFPAVDVPIDSGMTIDEADAPLMRKIFASVEQAGGERVDTRSDEFTMVELSAEVLFARNEYELTPEAERLVKDVAGEIREAGATEVQVLGHTDSRGSDADNQLLSERRAEAVSEALGAELADVSFSAEGRGESEPVASNQTDEGMAKNRRVAITFEGKDQ